MASKKRKASFPKHRWKNMNDERVEPHYPVHVYTKSEIKALEEELRKEGRLPWQP